MEPALWNALLLLNITRGVIVDSGANDGSTTVMLAKAFPKHVIWSIEPLEVNVQAIHANARKLSNVRIIHGGVGDALTFSSYPSFLNEKKAGVQTGVIDNYKEHRRPSRRSLFPIYTIDALMKHHTLAFAHIDVEGSEVNVLQGAKKTLERDCPPISVETFPITNSTRHKHLLKI